MLALGHLNGFHPWENRFSADVTKSDAPPDAWQPHVSSGNDLASLIGAFPAFGNVPCTPKACITLLDRYQIPIAGQTACVIGRSNIVGKPVSLLLMQRNA